LGQTKPPTYWRWTVLLNNAQIGLGALGELQMGAEEQTADHILTFCPLLHPPNGKPGLAALDDNIVNWLQTTAFCI